MKVYKSSFKVSAGRDAPFEEAWLVISSEQIRATWHRKDGTLIRPWSGSELGPSIMMGDDGLVEVPNYIFDTSLAVDEGL